MCINPKWEKILVRKPHGLSRLPIKVASSVNIFRTNTSKTSLPAIFPTARNKWMNRKLQIFIMTSLFVIVPFLSWCFNSSNKFLFCMILPKISSIFFSPYEDHNGSHYSTANMGKMCG